MKTSLLPATLDLVIVRYVESPDWSAYIALEQNPEVKRFVGGASPKTEEQLLRNLEGYRPNTELLAIADRSTNAYVGRCGLLHDKKTGESEVHCLLSEPYQRKGIGWQLVPLLARLAKEQSQTPVAIVDPNNAASLALLKHLGYCASGTITAEDYQDGHIRFLLEESQGPTAA